MKCRICKADNLRQLIDLGETPLADSFPKSPDEHEKFYPLKAFVCPVCFLIQLDSPVIPEDMFNEEYGFFTGGSPAAIKHFQAFAEDIISRFPEAQSVIEVASNDGTLLGFFKAADKWVLGIEPSRNTAAIARKQGIQTISKFFTEEYAQRLVKETDPVDLVLANNVLAHVPDPVDFLKGMRALVKNDGIVIVEVHHAVNLIHQLQFDNFYHEHYSYFLSEPLTMAFQAAGLKIFDIQQVDTQGGSLRVFASPKGMNLPIKPSVKEIWNLEHDLGMDYLPTYEGYQGKVDSLVRSLVWMIGDLVGQHKTVYAYGASAKSNTLLNYCGLGPDFISYMVDLTPEKEGRYTPGTHIEIISPLQEKLIGRPDYYLLTVWNYKKAVLAREVAFRTSGGQFIVPLPVPEIIG